MARAVIARAFSNLSGDRPKLVGRLAMTPRPSPEPRTDLAAGLPLGREVLGDPTRSGEDERRKMLELILRTDEAVMRALHLARSLALPDWRLASGAIYQTVWNALTGRPAGHGIRDFDLLYFDACDRGFAAEDRVIRRAARRFDGFSFPVEVRNQARVHLWFPEKFGQPYPQLACTDQALLNYASRTHAVAVRLEADGRLDIAAPFGLADIFAMRIVPNPALDNSATHAAKAERMKALWRELEVVPWPDTLQADAEALAACEGQPSHAVGRDWLRP
jgi:hypothetical protein